MLRGFCRWLMVFALVPQWACADALEKLDAFFDMDTFRAAFSQDVHEEDGALVDSSQGFVVFHRPGRFRWEYTRPEPYLIITDGLNLLVYDPGLKQARVHPTFETLGSAPLLLLLSPRKVFDDFRVDYAEHAVDSLANRGSGGRSFKWVKLEPKVDDTEFIRFDVGFGGSGLARMILYDRFGRRTLINFSDAETGVKIAPEQFRVNLPEDVDVMGNYLR